MVVKAYGVGGGGGGGAGGGGEAEEEVGEEELVGQRHLSKHTHFGESAGV